MSTLNIRAVFLALALLVGAWSLSLIAPHAAYSEAASIAQGVRSFDELSARFVTLAQEKGAVYALEVLKRAELPPNTDLHLLGHVVGDELYTQKGVEGIADCTQDFRNACSHSIVIGALNEYGGDGALPLIRDACLQAPGGEGAYTMCYHGLGHGVFAYYEYALPETVAFCRKTGTEAYHDREYFECMGGAIMELMGGGGHDREHWLSARARYLGQNPLSPCVDAVVPPDVRGICLVYLTPQLLERAGANLAQPDPATFPQAFSFCDAIPHTQQPLRDSCFGGFGKEFIPLAGARDIRRVDEFSDSEFETAIAWCGIATVADGRAACVADALASVFWGGENDPQAAVRFCTLVGEEGMQAACWERLALDISVYIGAPELQKELCAGIPEYYRGECLSS